MIETTMCLDGLYYKAICKVTGKAAFSKSEKLAIEALQERIKQEELLKLKYGDNWIEEFNLKAKQMHFIRGV